MSSQYYFEESSFAKRDCQAGTRRRMTSLIGIGVALLESLRFLGEEALDAEILMLLKPYSLRADWADDMIQLVKE